MKLLQFKKNHGFTLIELLVVISILGILATAGILTLNPVKLRKNATDAKVKSMISQLSKGVEAYYQANGKYPPLSTSAGVPDTSSTSDLINYINTWPAGFYYVRTSDNAYCICGGDSTTGNTGFWFGTNTPLDVKAIATTATQCSASYVCPSN